MSTQPRLIGAHVSASGGHYKAIERVAEIGCNCLQLFSGSPRVWKKPELSQIDTKSFFAKQKELGIAPIFTHALYLVNLASDKPEQVEKSINSLIYELQFDSLIKGSGVVVHLGSHQGRGWEACKDQLATTIARILKQTPDDSTFLIENSAGQNGKLCSDLNEIRWLLDQVNSPRLGWCLDTCHAHANGYILNPSSRLISPLGGEHQGDNRSPDKKGDGVATSQISEVSGVPATNLISPFKGEKLERSDSGVREVGLVLDTTITSLNLWSSLKCIHVNDSRDPFASGRDRHANIGDGEIPSDDLQYFLNIAQIQTLPLILEVPGLDGNGPDSENVKRVKEMVR